MLDKIKDKKVSSSVLAIIILVLILVCLFVLFYEINDYRNVKTEKHDFYYYFLSDRVDFQADIVLNSKDAVLEFNTNNIAITSSPIYYSNYDDKVILPSNMEIVYPYKNNPMYKVGKLSKIYYKNNYLYINTENGIGRLYDCFFYDGEDLYVIVEKTTIIVNGIKYELTPMSFVEATKSYVRIYNHKTKEYTLIADFSGDVQAYTDEYVIDLLNDTFTYANKYYMLIKNIEGLNFIELN